MAALALVATSCDESTNAEPTVNPQLPVMNADDLKVEGAVASAIDVTSALQSETPIVLGSVAAVNNLPAGYELKFVGTMGRDAAFERSVPVLLQPFSAECVQDGYFEFGGQKIPCRVLAKIDRSQVEGGYLYTFHALDRKVAEDDALLKQYYFEIFQISCLDVIRDWLQGYLGRKYRVMEERYCSPAFGPGFYGMEMEMTETLLALMNAEKAGVSYENGLMQPAMSVAGIYLVSKGDVLPVCRDCEGCIGQKNGYEFCKNYT